MIIDIAVGGIIYAIFSLFFSKPFDIYILGFAIFCALLPDLIEGVIFSLSKLVDKIFIFFGRRPPLNIYHHKIIHWPRVLIPLSCILLYYLTRDFYLTTICVANLLLHFIHDSLPPDPGPQWLFPPNTNHYCIDEKRKIVSRTRTEFLEVVRQFWEKRGQKGPSVWGELREAVKTTRTGKVLLLFSVAINFVLWIK